MSVPCAASSRCLCPSRYTLICWILGFRHLAWLQLQAANSLFVEFGEVVAAWEADVGAHGQESSTGTERNIVARCEWEGSAVEKQHSASCSLDAI